LLQKILNKVNLNNFNSLNFNSLGICEQINYKLTEKRTQIIYNLFKKVREQGETGEQCKNESKDSTIKMGTMRNVSAFAFIEVTFEPKVHSPKYK